MYRIRKIKRSDKQFYSLLGPIFGSRNVAKEVGIHCYDDESKQFFVAECDAGLMGLLSLKEGLISDCYVIPIFRRAGILAALIFEATRQPGNYRATCTPMSESVFNKHGFNTKKRTKNFASMEMSNA